MFFIIYLFIGLTYWYINAFVRKLDIDGDWLLPIVWFLFWPLVAVTWLIILFQYSKDYILNKFSKNQL